MFICDHCLNWSRFSYRHEGLLVNNYVIIRIGVVVCWNCYERHLMGFDIGKSPVHNWLREGF